MIKINEQIITPKYYNDGTYRLNYDLISAQTTITWLYDGEEELSFLFFIINHLRNSLHLENLILNMPYTPNSRADRVYNKAECFTLKYFCDFINMLQFKRVRVFDPHSFVTEALLNNVEVISPRSLIQELLNKNKNIIPFLPDQGAVKRNSININAPYLVGTKIRNYETQKIESLEVAGAKHMIAGHDILIIDDIISRGSTTYMAAKKLKELGAYNIYVYASHVEKTVLGAHLNGQSLLDIPDLITSVYTTNSLWRGIEHEKVKVIKEW